MKIRYRPPFVLEFESPAGRRVAFVTLAAFRGAILSYFVFVAFVYPLSYLRWLQGPIVLLAKLLSAPIYCFGKIVPPLASPLFGGPFESPDIWGLLRPHMIAGVASYVLLFHAPALIRVLRRRLGAKEHARA